MRTVCILIALVFAPLSECLAMKFNCDDGSGYPPRKLEINTDSKTAKYAAHNPANYDEINGFWVCTTYAIEDGNQPFIKSFAFMFNKRDQKMTLTLSHFSDKFVKELGLQQVRMSTYQCTRPLD